MNLLIKIPIFWVVEKASSSLYNIKETMTMRVPRLSQMMAALALIIALSCGFGYSAATAKRYYGACGGGSTLADFIASAKSHGVLDDLARKTGQTPGVDGSSAKIVKDNYVRVRVTRGVYVTNYTCTNGHFKRLSQKKYLPAGTILWVPQKIAPAKGKSKTIHWAAQENCGNKASGNIPVKRPGKPPKKHKKKVTKKPAPKPAPPSGTAIKCNVGELLIMKDSGLACQGISQSQEAKVDNNCKQITSNNSSQCLTLINQYQIAVNANCSEVHLVYSDQSTTIVYQDTLGNEITKNICSTQVVTPPPCSENCNPPNVDHLPQISCVLLAHIYYPKGTAQLACKATDPDGDPIDPNIVATGAAHASGTLETPNYGKDPCPTGYTCYTTRLDADYVGFVTITATAVANGVPSIPWLGTYPVEPNDFGSY